MAIKATIHLANESAGILRPGQSIGQRINAIVDRYARIMREERQLLLEELKPTELALLHDAFRDYTGNVRDFEAWCAYIVQAMPADSETRAYLQIFADAQFVALLELLEGPAPDYMVSGTESRAAIERLRAAPDIPAVPPDVDRIITGKHIPMVVCGQCRRDIQFEAVMIGKTMKCQHCGTVLRFELHEDGIVQHFIHR